MIHDKFTPKSLPHLEHWFHASEVSKGRITAITYRDDIPEDEALKSYIKNNRASIIFPVSLMTEHVGYVCRNIQDKSFYVTSRLPGFYMTNAFLENIENFTYGTKILLCEGAVDAEWCSQHYPYTIAYLTSSVSTKISKILSLFTNQFAICPDNDSAGKKGAARSRAALNSNGAEVEYINLPHQVKDAGDLFLPENSLHAQIFSLQLTLI